jgi:type I restriction enzyme M protein
LAEYWTAYPGLKDALFQASKRIGYLDGKVAKDAIKQTIFNHPDFKAFSANMSDVFKTWEVDTIKEFKALESGFKPKQIIHQIAECLLATYTGKSLMDKYDVYQHLMNYWNEVMQDDLYQIAEDGWVASPYRIIEKNKKTGKETDKGWTCDLIPPSLMINQYFKADKEALDALEAERENFFAQLTELEEEYSGEEGLFADFDKLNKGTVAKRLKEIGKNKDAKDEIEVLNRYLELSEQQTKLNTDIKKAAETLDQKALEQYKKLSEDEVKHVVVVAKWMNAMETATQGEMERISQRLTGRIKELMERYETPLPEIDNELAALEAKVNAHLNKMGFVW